MPQIMTSELVQKELHDKIALQLKTQFDEPYSQQYRARFINTPLFDGIPLRGKDVIEGMCACGPTTQYLVSKGANVTAVDISENEINVVKQKLPNCTTVRASILDSGLPDSSYDCAVIVGGLHHVHPHVTQAVREIHRLLKPGGHFCFMEPHTGSVSDLFRKVWYRYDRLFMDNEAAVNIETLKTEFSRQFKFNTEKYTGCLAYLLVFNSMFLRIPIQLKPLYALPLMKLEALIDRYQGKLFSCFVIAQWQKK